MTKVSHRSNRKRIAANSENVENSGIGKDVLTFIILIVILTLLSFASFA